MKKVVITGGSSGVGAQMAKDFAEAGHQVFICGRREKEIEQVAALHPFIVSHVADVSQEQQICDFFDRVEQDGQPAQIVIANAGIAKSAPLHHTSLALFQQHIDINLTGVFITLREAVRRLKKWEINWARLIAISSMTAKKGYPYISAYSASKHGVLGLVRSAAQELAQTQITVNAVCPGYLDTEMTAESVAQIMSKTEMSAEQATDILKKFSPQNRLFSAHEVSALVRYLASESAAGITGQALSVDGGETS